LEDIMTPSKSNGEGSNSKTVLSNAGLLLAGAGIGWLVGLSATPVVSIVITSAIGTAAAVVTAMSGLENQGAGSVGAWRVRTWPMAWFIIGLVIGSLFGVTARNQSWLGSDLSGEITKWTNLGLDANEVTQKFFAIQYPASERSQDDSWLTSSGITATAILSSEVKMWTDVGLSGVEVARRLFEIKYPATQATAAPAPLDLNPTQAGVLFDVIVGDECDELLGLEGNDLRRSLQSSTVQQLRGLTDVIVDDEMLKEVVEVLCVAESS
jgi:hypothetical protein